VIKLFLNEVYRPFLTFACHFVGGQITRHGYFSSLVWVFNNGTSQYKYVWAVINSWLCLLHIYYLSTLSLLRVLSLNRDQSLNIFLLAFVFELFFLMERGFSLNKS
jgi:hypothetical protein